MRQSCQSPLTQQVSEEQRHEFATNSQKFLAFRKAIESDGNTAHGITLMGSEIQKDAVNAFRAMMRGRLAKKPEIAEFLIPSFAVGCRRLSITSFLG